MGSNLLKRRLDGATPLQVMATHSPLSARLAEEAGFDGLWASGFELSALYGLADVSLLSLTQHLDMVRGIVGQVSIPVIADVDTGHGNAVNVHHVVREYERAGAAALVIEDKTFPKVTSLVPGGRQELVRTEEFAGKIESAASARTNSDFLIIARTEALIAGLSVDEALARCSAYESAGADLILVHSKSREPGEIEKFAAKWSGLARLVVVPTSYPQFSIAHAQAVGKIGIVIYGNHAVRASVSAMQSVFEQILREGSSLGVETQISSVAEIFRLQQMDVISDLEKRFLR